MSDLRKCDHAVPFSCWDLALDSARRMAFVGQSEAVIVWDGLHWTATRTDRTERETSQAFGKHARVGINGALRLVNRHGRNARSLNTWAS